ncbi:hypothetical protein D018_0983A, partial [Vibrio parahaemolyticus VP2007-007]
MKFKAPFVST